MRHCRPRPAFCGLSAPNPFESERRAFGRQGEAGSEREVRKRYTTTDTSKYLGKIALCLPYFESLCFFLRAITCCYFFVFIFGFASLAIFSRFKTLWDNVEESLFALFRFLLLWNSNVHLLL